MIYGSRSNGKLHGIVMTKQSVVEVILDRISYLPSVDLRKIQIVEPAAGNGAFAIEIVKRLYDY